MPQPKTQKQVKQVLGIFSFYRRFIKDFSKIAKPLFNMLKKDSPKNVKWTEEAEDAYTHLKQKLTSAPVLVNPKEELEVSTEEELTKVKELGVDAIVLEQRGALLTRLGTLIGYSASAMAITIVKIPPLLKPEAYAETYNVLEVILQDGQASSLHYCAEYLSVIYSYYRKQTEQLEDATAMIFKTKTQFSHMDLCKAFDGYECKHGNRNKRFLDPVGAGMTAVAKSKCVLRD